MGPSTPTNASKEVNPAIAILGASLEPTRPVPSDVGLTSDSDQKEAEGGRSVRCEPPSGSALEAGSDFDSVAQLLPNDGGLAAIADEIKNLQLEKNAREARHWYKVGLLLLKAKALQPHGGFEAWCKRKLQYSQRTAEKLMRAAAAFQLFVKSELESFLPPPTLAYTISAFPEDERDRVVSFIMAGGDARKTVRAMVKILRKKAFEATSVRALESKAHTERVHGDEQIGLPQGSDLIGDDGARREVARASATKLIAEQMGGRERELISLLEAAGPGVVFNSHSEEDLLIRLRALVPEQTGADASICTAASDEFAHDYPKARKVIVPAGPSVSLPTSAGEGARDAVGTPARSTIGPTHSARLKAHAASLVESLAEMQVSSIHRNRQI